MTECAIAASRILLVYWRLFEGERSRRALVKSGLEIERWKFWSPQTRVPREWLEHWSRSVEDQQTAEVPADLIPAMHRRRMSALSKLAVQIGLEASEGSHADFLVFCSQHGEMSRTRGLLGDIAAGAALSPASFSQSVHNASAGLYTIIAESRVPASAIAAGANTFAYGWLEAEAFLAVRPHARVLLVSYDEPLPAEYRPYTAQKQCLYGLALMLRSADAAGITLDPAPAEQDEPLPMGPVFIAWAESGRRALQIPADGQGWEWRRSAREGSL